MEETEVYGNTTDLKKAYKFVLSWNAPTLNRFKQANKNHTIKPRYVILMGITSNKAT